MPTAAPVLSSHLPAAARKQVKAANKLIAELNAPPGAVVDPPAAAAAPVLPEVNLDAPAGAQPAGSAPVGDPAPNYEQMYRSLQGKYNKEVAEVQSDNAETQRMLARAITENATAAAAASVRATAPPPVVVKAEDRFKAIGVTDKEIEEYGTEMMDIVERIANARTTAEIGEFKRELAELKKSMGTVTTVVAQDAQQKIYDALFREVGQNWPEINASAEFLAWLRDVDVFSGTSRNTSLQVAFKNHDAARVVAIFKAYVGGKTLTAPTPPTPRQPAVERGTLVAPGAARGGDGEAPGATDGKIWSEEEIQDFYQRARKRKVVGEEYTNTQAEIVRAIAEGRVRPTKHSQHHLNGQ